MEVPGFCTDTEYFLLGTSCHAVADDGLIPNICEQYFVIPIRGLSCKPCEQNPRGVIICNKVVASFRTFNDWVNWCISAWEEGQGCLRLSRGE